MPTVVLASSHSLLRTFSEYVLLVRGLIKTKASGSFSSQRSFNSGAIAGLIRRGLTTLPLTRSLISLPEYVLAIVKAFSLRLISFTFKALA